MPKLSEVQKELLVNYMESHPELVSTKFTANFKPKDSSRLWESICKTLNSSGGTKKTPAGWRKTWHDLLRVSKLKAAKIKQSEEPCLETLSAHQKRIIAVLEAKALQRRRERENNIKMIENVQEPQYATVTVLETEPESTKSEVYSVVLIDNEQHVEEPTHESTPATTETEPECSSSELFSMVLVDGEHHMKESPQETAPSTKSCARPAGKRLPKAEEVSKRMCSINEQRLVLKREALRIQKERLKQDKEKTVLKHRSILAKEATAAALERIALALEIRNEIL